MNTIINPASAAVFAVCVLHFLFNATSSKLVCSCAEQWLAFVS